VSSLASFVGPAAVDAAPPPKTPPPAALLTRAAYLVDTHTATTGTPITATQLAEQMRVTVDTAEQLLAVLTLDAARHQPAIMTANGTPTPDTLR
jgi:hypothetical protein